MSTAYPHRAKSSNRARLVIFAASLLMVLLAAEWAAAHDNWTTLAQGLDLAQFKVQESAPAGDSLITVLRIDPAQWDLRILSVVDGEDAQAKSTREWCHTYGMTAAINAGMFNTDNRTHTGYMKCGNHTNNATINRYKSVAAFSPGDSKAAPFRIFDLDETDLSAIENDYSCVIQNLRLIDRSGRNRWTEQSNKWSEAALGEDRQGRVLFIYCRSPYSMHDFNRILLGLPIELVCAQHLEGGPEAQLYLSAGGRELELVGSYETGFNESDWNTRAWPVPNVIGITQRKP